MGDTGKFVLAAALCGAVVLALVLLLLRGFGGEREQLPATASGDTARPADTERPRIAPPPAHGKRRGTDEQREDRKRSRARQHTINPDANPDMPKRPPLILDADMRDAYRQWWLAETERRSRIYLRRKSPDDTAAPDALAPMLEAYYDAAEARRPNETDDQYIARQSRHHALLTEFMDRFGTSLHSMLSYGGDSQFGRGEPPPIDVDVGPQ